MENKVYLKQWRKLLKQEQTYLKRRRKKNISGFDDFIANKIPDKLQNTLRTAFSKAFAFIFDKGTGIIEKCYCREEMEHKHKVNTYALSLKQDKKRISAFDKETNTSKNKNVMISGVKGVGLGLLGIGLPDIPILIGMVLKGIYEIALQYGYNYESESERFFILNIISTALQYGDDAIKGNAVLNTFIQDPTVPNDYDQKIQIDRVADIMSNELLIMKFLQGVMIVGVVGGIYDAVTMRKILTFAKLKYKRRFLYANKE